MDHLEGSQYEAVVEKALAPSSFFFLIGPLSYLSFSAKASQMEKAIKVNQASNKGIKP